MAKAFKLTGTGNHFILVDLRHDETRQAYAKYDSAKTRAALARSLCNPFQSVGGDGLLFLETSHKADLKWDFYNADGSAAEMCGNAARCVACYIEKYSTATFGEISIETKAGVIRARRATADGQYEIDMPEIKIYKPNQRFNFNKKAMQFNFVNSGVPHAVIELSGKTNLQSVAKNSDHYEMIVAQIRKLSQFKKSGTNVTFYIAKSKDAILTLTFERGVSGFTQACGTGAVAATFCHRAKSSAKSSHRILATVPGGQLAVHWQNSKPTLIGPAKLVAAIDIMLAI